MSISDKKTKLLEIREVKKYFPVKKHLFSRAKTFVKAVDDVSFDIYRGQTLGLVGESGSGKTTLGKCIIRAYEPTAGKINFNPTDAPTIDLATADNSQIKSVRKYMHMIFQDPYASLNPRMTVLDIVSEPLICSKVCDRAQVKERVKHLLEEVGLEIKHMNRYPHAFSGGQRQRIGIARSLAASPDFIICDEAVSALDVSVQAQILNLLAELQRKFNLTYLFIAHDLAVVEHIADSVAVMYVGKIMELAPTEQLFKNPSHPYTEALLSAVPKTNPDIKMKRIILDGDIPNPADPPSGCYFHPRCSYAKDICSKQAPTFRQVEDEHYSACHFSSELKLKGVLW